MSEVPKNLLPYQWAQREWRNNIKEIPGKEHNPQIIWYHSFTTLRATDDETPWCSAFMCAAAENSGYKSTRSAAAISWETYGIHVPFEKAQEGDILVFKRSVSGQPRARHVAFFVCSSGEGMIECLGGNQSNKVGLKKYPKKDLIAVRRFPG